MGNFSALIHSVNVFIYLNENTTFRRQVTIRNKEKQRNIKQEGFKVFGFTFKYVFPAD